MPRSITWEVERFDVHEGTITVMSLPGGQVWRWAYQRRQRVQRLSKVKCPKRTHALSESITADYDASSPPQHVIMTVSAGSAFAPYAVFVHEGTEGPIFPRTVDFFTLRPWPPHGWTKASSVRGQRSQPFLGDALDEVMRDL